MGCRGQLVTLYRARWIDSLRTSRRAFANECARPGAVGRGEYVSAIRRAFVARVQVVTLTQSDRRWTEEVHVQRVHRACRVAQHAVDAHAELLEFVQFGWGLQVFAIIEGPLVLTDDPGLDSRQFGHEVTDVDNEIADHWEVSHRLHSHRPRQVIGKERRAPQFRVAVDRHTAAAAYAHPTRPSEAQRPVEVILDVVQTVQDRPFAGKGNFVRLQDRLGLDLRSIP